MDHDHSYKNLFSHPEMVADLLRGFVREEWVEQVDFATLERMSGSYVTDDLREREDDIIWRMRWGKDWLYVYLLLEFQSQVDRFMAVRIMTYLGLLYQDIIRGGLLTAGGRLPPVLPVVLYNGEPRWTAAEDINDLIEKVPGGLAKYRPTVRYLLLDEGRYGNTELAPLRNLVAALFRLENSRTPTDVSLVLENLIAWLAAPEQVSIRRAFTVWLKRVFLPGRLSGVEIEEIQDIQEVRSMLAERVKEWTREWENHGWQKGRAALLLKLIERKFGAVDETLRRRVAAASSEQLERWGERILTAASLEEMFG